MSLGNHYIGVLKNHQVFAKLNDSELTSLLQFAKVVRLDRGQHLFKQGDPAEHFYYVVEGQVKLFKLLRDGSEKIVKIMRSNNAFAHALVLKKTQNYPICAQSVTKTTLISFRSQDYLNLLKHNHELALDVMQTMSDNINHLMNDIEILSLKDATTRVIHYFQALRSDLANNEQTSSTTIVLPAAKHMIASMLAIQPETLSRIFHRLQDKGYIEVSGATITVLEPERLLNYAG